jgi:hypothetical protein
MRLLEKLNTPSAFLVVLVIVLVTNGFLFYNYRLAAGDDAPSSPPPGASTHSLTVVDGGQVSGREEVPRAEETDEEPVLAAPEPDRQTQYDTQYDTQYER